MTEFGTASAAAKILGMTKSQFNRARLAGTYIYDPVAESVAHLASVPADRRPSLSGLLPCRAVQKRGYPGLQTQG